MFTNYYTEEQMPLVLANKVIAFHCPKIFNQIFMFSLNKLIACQLELSCVP